MTAVLAVAATWLAVFVLTTIGLLEASREDHR